MEKFKIKLSSIKYGWMNIDIYVDNKLITRISGSGVYNPFYEIDDLFKALRARKHFNWEIDQEGRIAELKIKNLRKILIVTVTNEFRKSGEMEETFTFSKKQFLNELRVELNKFRKRERRVLRENHYYFNFRKII